MLRWIIAILLLLPPAAYGDLTGVATLDGKAPPRKPIDLSGCPECDAMHPDPLLDQTVIVDAKNHLQNAVIYLKTDSKQKIPTGDPNKKPALLLDQKGCVFIPHVLAIQTGRKLQIRNSDRIAHNAMSNSVDNASFNYSQNPGDVQDVPPFTDPEVFWVKCNTHTWMIAWFVVVDSPYYAVTAADGTFTIDTKDLPDGTYTFTAWHEKYAPLQQTITVKSGKSEKPLDFTFKADSTPAS